jgi:hypothetical protein
MPKSADCSRFWKIVFNRGCRLRSQNVSSISRNGICSRAVRRFGFNCEIQTTQRFGTSQVKLLLIHRRITG